MIRRRLGTEVLGLLWSTHLLRKVTSNAAEAMANMEAATFRELLHNDVILRLCKLRDDDNRSVSFDQVWKDVRTRSGKKHDLEGMESEIAKFRTLTINLAKHRDSYIAHLEKRSREHLSPPTEMLDAVRLAVQIADTLAGEREQYRVLGLDLRTAVLGDEAA